MHVIIQPAAMARLLMHINLVLELLMAKGGIGMGHGI